MPIYRLKNSGEWRKLAKIYRLKNTGAWRSLSRIYRLKANGTWRKIFSSEVGPEISQQVTISQTTSSTTGLVTLTGTNYNWTNANSLTYFFEWYSSGSWQTLDSGSIANPTSGSSNTKTYVVQQIQANPNDDNLYRFRVRATNINLQTNSTSDTTTISTPRNVTNVTASQVGTDLQATVSFTVGLYTGSVVITRYKYSGATLQATTDFNRTTSSPATIPLDEYNKSYRFAVTPYTGSLVSSTVTGYNGNTSDMSSAFTSNFPPAPVQTSSPTLSSTGDIVVGTSLSATRGTYQTNTILDGNPDLAIQTRVYGWAFPGPTLTNGTTTPPPTPSTTSGGTSSLTTTQLMVNYTFYAVDIVTSADGLSTYYYYSDLTARTYIPSFSDNFDRLATTGSQGLGQTSTGSWYWSTYNTLTSTVLYGYQTPTVDQNGLSWQIDNEEISGRKTAYVNSNPSSGASASSYPLKTINVADSNVSLKVAVADGGGGPGLAFWVTSGGSWWAVAPSYSQAVVTTYPCTDGPYTHTSTTCPATTPGSTTVGVICSCTAGSTTTNCSGTRTHYNSLTDAQLSCGSCTITQTANYYSSCPTPTTSSPKYSNNTLGTGCGDKCSCLGPYTEQVLTGSQCGTTETGLGTAVVVVTCSIANIGQPCNQRIVTEGGITVYYVKYCEGVYSPSTYYNCTTRTCSDSWSCTYQSVTTNASYYKVGTTTTTTNATYYKVQQLDTTTYYSTINILSSVGSSVTSAASLNVASSTSSYTPIYGLSVDTSGDVITAKAYSNLAVTNQLGSTLTHTASSPTKSIAGDSAVGIINTPTPANRITGNRLDNFVYTNV